MHIFFVCQISGDSVKMPDSTEHQISEGSECVRLLIPNETEIPEVDTSESETHDRKWSSIWWVKAILWCAVSVIILLVCIKWVVPFLAEKVFQVIFF